MKASRLRQRRPPVPDLSDSHDVVLVACPSIHFREWLVPFLFLFSPSPLNLLSRCGLSCRITGRLGKIIQAVGGSFGPCNRISTGPFVTPASTRSSFPTTTSTYLPSPFPSLHTLRYPPKNRTPPYAQVPLSTIENRPPSPT